MGRVPSTHMHIHAREMRVLTRDCTRAGVLELLGSMSPIIADDGRSAERPGSRVVARGSDNMSRGRLANCNSFMQYPSRQDGGMEDAALKQQLNALTRMCDEISLDLGGLQLSHDSFACMHEESLNGSLVLASMQDELSLMNGSVRRLSGFQGSSGVSSPAMSPLRSPDAMVSQSAVHDVERHTQRPQAQRVRDRVVREGAGYGGVYAGVGVASTKATSLYSRAKHT